MSTYDTLQSSVEGSRPVELYTFAIGATSYLFTSAEDDYTLGADVYLATSLVRSEVAQSPDDRNRFVTVAVPASNAFAALYVNVVPSTRATLTIRRVQRDETPTPVAVVIFKGFVKAVAFNEDGLIASIAAQSIEAATARTIPRRTFQGMCNHQLYDARCQAIPSAHQFTGVVSAQSGTVLTVTGLSASGMDFIGGYVKPIAVSDFRMVLDQSGDDITLLLPFVSSMVGLQVDVFEGCDHIINGDCALRFDNVINFGGFPFVPMKNPFATGLD